MMGPMVLHMYLILFPGQKWLHYVYLSTVVPNIYILTRYPFKNNKRYVHMLYVILGVFPTLVCLWFFKCTNYMCYDL